MKSRPLLLIVTATLMYSCNRNESSSGDVMTKYLQPDSLKEQATPTSLHTTAKWKTDESTRSHATRLRLMVNEFESTAQKDKKAYKFLAEELKKELKGLIADCNMKGPEHEALHAWLALVLNDVEKLQKISSADEGQDIVKELLEKLDAYNKTFI